MSGVTVRTAVPDDAAAIAPIDVAHGEGTAESLVPRIRRALERNLQRGSRRYSCVAVVGSRIAGYGKTEYCDWSDATGTAPRPPEGWYLTGVAVMESDRRQGLGRALTAHRIEWLRERAGAVYYFTGEGNHPSQALHGAFGFVELARALTIPLPRPFSNDELHILYELRFA